MRRVAMLCICFFTTPMDAQVVEVQTRPASVVRTAADKSTLEVLNRGFVDFQSGGQLQASAQVIKIRIGDPYGFSLPIYLLTGASKPAFGNSSEADATVMDLVAPIGGFLSGMVSGNWTLLHSRSKVSKLDIKGQLAARAISAQGATTNSRQIFGAGYLDAGLYAQTGAWEEVSGYQDGGVAWLQVVYAGSLASRNKLQELFGATAEQPFGIRIEGGILIQSKVNIKLGAYLPQTGKDLPSLDKTQARFAFDYTVK